MSRKDGSGLTDQQRAFCDGYLANGLNASAAYSAAYPKCKGGAAARSNAARLLTNDNVAQYLSKMANEKSERAGLNIEWVLTRLMQITERCMQAEPVMIFDEAMKAMVESGEYKFDSAGANRSLELLGKYQKMFTDRKLVDVKVNGKVSYVQNLSGGDTEEGGDE